MEKDFSTQYIKANAPTVAENCIKCLFWENRSFCDVLSKSEDHIHEYHYCDASKFTAAVIDILRNLTTADAVKAFANQQRRDWVSPSYKTAADYIKHGWEIDASAAEIASAISTELRTVKAA